MKHKGRCAARGKFYLAMQSWLPRVRQSAPRYANEPGYSHCASRALSAGDLDGTQWGPLDTSVVHDPAGPDGVLLSKTMSGLQSGIGLGRGHISRPGARHVREECAEEQPLPKIRAGTTAWEGVVAVTLEAYEDELYNSVSLRLQQRTRVRGRARV
jgi:hypothetical protein